MRADFSEKSDIEDPNIGRGKSADEVDNGFDGQLRGEAAKSGGNLTNLEECV